DISRAAVEWGRNNLKLLVPTDLIAGDVLKVAFGRKQYDTVFSLSCADWNIETNKIINACWQKVKPGGYFIISLRLTDQKGINDVRQSFQRINFSGREKEPEIANYVVFNVRDILKLFKELMPSPETIGAYGYWGKPSVTAVTPFKKLAFTVFYIKKSRLSSGGQIRLNLSMPLDAIL
ncbi:class I SAM-dependent methyltransferase, partial [Candidatus Margulisiibacteriota bacterium]